MDKARRELHAVDRRDWPPLALMYGLPWEQYFEKKEAVLFENPAVGACPQGVVVRVCSRWLAVPLYALALSLHSQSPRSGTGRCRVGQ
jgi:hypothetical protein